MEGRERIQTGEGVLRHIPGIRSRIWRLAPDLIRHDTLDLYSDDASNENLFDVGKTRKAFKYLKEADKYYSLHEDQEFRARIETLDLLGKVLSQQKKQFRIITLGSIALAILAIILLAVGRKAWIFRRQRDAADAVIDEALEDSMESEEHEVEPFLTKREEEILPLIAEGMTSPQIAEKLFLSIATIKWYRKKLLQKIAFGIP